MQQQQNSQLVKANDGLVALVPNITAEDRKAAQEKYSEPTIIKYLKGRGTDLDTSVDLLEFFTKRIADREKKITKAVSEVQS